MYSERGTISIIIQLDDRRYLYVLHGQRQAQNQLTKSHVGNIVDGFNWSLIEVNVTVICACVIASKPAISFLLPTETISRARRKWTLCMSKRTRNAQSQRQWYSDRSTQRQTSSTELPVFNEYSRTYDPLDHDTGAISGMQLDTDQRSEYFNQRLHGS